MFRVVVLPEPSGPSSEKKNGSLFNLLSILWPTDTSPSRYRPEASRKGHVKADFPPTIDDAPAGRGALPGGVRKGEPRRRGSMPSPTGAGGWSVAVNNRPPRWSVPATRNPHRTVSLSAQRTGDVV